VDVGEAPANGDEGFPHVLRSSRYPRLDVDIVVEEVGGGQRRDGLHLAPVETTLEDAADEGLVFFDRHSLVLLSRSLYEL
jgi:hypothetical protein